MRLAAAIVPLLFLLNEFLSFILCMHTCFVSVLHACQMNNNKTLILGIEINLFGTL